MATEKTPAQKARATRKAGEKKKQQTGTHSTYMGHVTGESFTDSRGRYTTVGASTVRTVKKTRREYSGSVVERTTESVKPRSRRKGEVKETVTKSTYVTRPRRRYE